MQIIKQYKRIIVTNKKPKKIQIEFLEFHNHFSWLKKLLATILLYKN